MKKTLLLLFILGSCSLVEDVEPKVFDLPYSIKIRNEHEVLLTSKKDTVVLYLENAYSLADEHVIFIKKK